MNFDIQTFSIFVNLKHLVSGLVLSLFLIGCDDLNKLSSSKVSASIDKSCSIDTIEPHQAPAGTNVTIKGGDFLKGVYVTVGEHSVSGMNLVDLKHLKFTIPKNIAPGLTQIVIHKSAPCASSAFLVLNEDGSIPDNKKNGDQTSPPTDDSLKNADQDEDDPIQTTDSLDPIPGDNGLLSSTNITYVSVDLNWTVSTDQVSQPANLKYFVFSSLTDNIGPGVSAQEIKNVGSLANLGGTYGISTLNISGLIPGTTYYWNVIVEDEAGNQSTYAGATVTTLDDTTPPVVSSVSTPTFAKINATGSATIDVTCNETGDAQILDGADDSVFLDWTPVTMNLAQTLTISGADLQSELGSDGSMSLKVLCRDQATTPNVSLADTTQSITLDTSAPNVASVSSPANGSLSAGGSTDIDVTCDEDGAARILNNADDSELVAWTTVSAGVAETLSLSGSGLGDGAITLKVECRDDTNTPNVSAPNASRSITIDNTGPAVTGTTAPVLAKLNSTGTTTMGVTCAEDGHARLLNNSGGLEITGWTAVSGSVNANLTITGSALDTATSSTDGVVTIKAECRDQTVTPNTGTANTSRTIIFDSTKPTVVSVSVPTNSKVSDSDSSDIDVKCSEDGAVRVLDNGDGDLILDWVSVTANTSKTLTIAGSTLDSITTDGSVTLKVECRDDASAENISDPDTSRSLTLDTTAPTISAVTAPGASIINNAENTTLDVTCNNGDEVQILDNADDDIITDWTTVSSGVATSITIEGSDLDSATTADGPVTLKVVCRDDAPTPNVSSSNTSRTIALDTSAPTPGSYSISPSLVANNAFTINWTLATDLVSPQTSLRYFAYISTTDNISSSETIADIQSNGTLINSGGTLNVGQYTATGLDPSTTYYFNVIVEDEKLHKEAYTGNSVVTLADTKPPSPGATGSIAISGVKSDELTISWQAAIDDVDPASELEYRLIWSPSNNLKSLASANGNGTEILTFTANATSFVHTGLSPETEYFYNVIVRDQSGNEKVYDSNSGTTINGAGVGTSSSPSATGNSAQKKTFYDDINNVHWVFFYNGTGIEYAYSSDTTSWTTAGTLPYDTNQFVANFYNDSGTPYVLVGVEDSFDIKVRRGTLTANSVAFGSEKMVYDGTSATNHYRAPYIAVNGSKKIWIGAIHMNEDGKQAQVKLSQDPLSGDLSLWNAAETLDIRSNSLSSVILLNRSGDDMYALLDNVSGNIKGYQYNGTWSLGESGGQVSWAVDGVADLSTINDMAILGSDLYVVGFFQKIGGVEGTNNIAKWDGNKWNALGSGLSSAVYTIEVFGSKIYVGGYFSSAGGIPNTSKVAAWDGAAWSAVGPNHGLGNGDYVYSILKDGHEIYVCGKFADGAGDASSDNIMKTDGIAWYPLGSGLDNTCRGIEKTPHGIYAAGYFDNAGGVPASKVARWDGSTWSAIGTGATGYVYTTASQGDDFYIGGSFTSVSGVANTSRIAKWNGESWAPLGMGLSSWVYSIVPSGTNLYVGGYFIDAGGDTNADYAAVWNGSNWANIGGSEKIEQGYVTAMAATTDKVYAAGPWEAIGGNPALKKMSEWDGSKWNDLKLNVSQFTDGIIYDIVVNGTDVYIGGNFDNWANIPEADNVVKWDGTTWSALGPGLSSYVYDLHWDSATNTLYAGGGFVNAGGNSTADYVAKYNGTTWVAVGSGAVGDFAVNAIEVVGSDVFIAGSFEDWDGNGAADKVAYWDDSANQWKPMGTGLTGITTNPTVYGLKEYNGDIYACGNFVSAGPTSDLSYLAKWNEGTNTWVFPDVSLGNYCRTLEIHAGDLYVGGAFYDAVDGLGDMLIKYNGTTWSSVAGGLSGTVYSIQSVGSDLYLGGYFSYISGDPDHSYVTKWNGTAYESLSAGNLNSAVYAVGYDGTTLHAGGVFDGFYAQQTTAITPGSEVDAVTNSSGAVHMTYLNNMGDINHKKYDGTWHPADSIQTGGSYSSLGISLNQGNDDLLVYWLEGGNVTYNTSTDEGSTWSATTVLSQGENRNLCVDPRVGGGQFNFVWTNGSFSPHSVSSQFISP